MADIDSIRESSGLHVVEGQFVSNSWVGLVTEPPGSFIVAGGILIAGLLLHDEAHVLVGLGGALVVIENFPQELTGHVELASLDVDVSQQQPTSLQVLGVLEIPAVLGDPLELVPGTGSLFEEHVGRGHPHHGPHVLPLVVLGGQGQELGQ